MRYSHSRIELYKNCPKAFSYKYIEKPKIEEKKGIEAFLGSMVHKALEKLYTDLRFSRLDTLDDILDYYTSEWDSNFDLTIEIVKEGYSKENYKEMGKRFITDYYKKYYPFDQGKTIGLEMEINLRLLDESSNPYDLLGYIDRLTMVSEDFFEIHDYKTNSHTKTQEEIEKDWQLALYTIAVKRMYPSVKKVELVWHFLDSGMEMRTAKSDKELELLEKEVIASIKQIERSIKAGDFPAKESSLCNWCSFKEICPLKSHLFMLKKLPENEYLNEEGVRLVQRYLELTKQKKELSDTIDPELEKVKLALLNYAKLHNSERVYGSFGDSILVKEYITYILPEKGTRERIIFEKILKDNKLWDSVAEVNSFLFSKAVSERVIDAETLMLLEKLISKSKTPRFYPSSKK